MEHDRSPGSVERDEPVVIADLVFCHLSPFQIGLGNDPAKGEEARRLGAEKGPARGVAIEAKVLRELALGATSSTTLPVKLSCMGIDGRTEPVKRA